MPARRRVSVKQMELLVEFAESNPDIAFGRFRGGPQAARVTREAWNTVAVQLNLVAKGTTKTPGQWRRYWIEFKAKTKAKAADSRRNESVTGGGPNKLVPLNEIEKRVLAILGPAAVKVLPGVRLPIDLPSASEIEASTDSGIPAPDPVSYPSTSSSAPISQSSSPISLELQPMVEEWLYEEELPESPYELPSSASTLRTSPPSTPKRIKPTQTQPVLPLSIEVKPAEQPANTSRDDICRDESPPRWAYENECRRIAAEERHATALEALVELVREIRNAVLSHLNRY